MCRLKGRIKTLVKRKAALSKDCISLLFTDSQDINTPRISLLKK